MEKDELYNYVSLFQNAIIELKDKLSVEFQFFPSGSCRTTCILLGTFLTEIGCKNFKMEIGEKYDSNGQEYSHAWLETDNSFVIDITAYQFKDITKKIIFGKKPLWYNSWIITEEIENPNIYHIPVGPHSDYENYEIIMQKLDSIDKELEWLRS